MATVMSDLAFDDVRATEAGLYRAAKAWIAVLEASFVAVVDVEGPDYDLRTVADELHDAARRHEEALNRWDQTYGKVPDYEDFKREGAGRDGH